MRKTLLFLFCLTGMAGYAAIYTRINNKPVDGWAGTYLLVYEHSATEAYVWNGEDAQNNYTKATIANGKINADLTDLEVTITEESTNRYYVRSNGGYIGTEAKKNGLYFFSSGRECTLQSNGGYTILETNTNTCRFLCYETSSAFRFRFYYDDTKKWNDSKKHNIYLYALGEPEQEDPQNQLDLQYAHAEMYACESKFPTQSNPYDQYFLTYLFLAQEEADDAVPQIWLEILAPTQYSIEGTYKSDYTAGQKYFLNCQAGSKHSYFIFPNKSEQGWGQAAINLAEMTISKVGPSQYPNAYTYHIKLVFTDSNKKIWTLDKDMDVYGWWIDCDRSGEDLADMEPVPFALESGNHEAQAIESTQITNPAHTRKVLIDGNLFILRTIDGQEPETYTLQGQKIK